ncbi:MAG: cytochrome b/b6 domain-containing protein [Burkholderiales bacterium]|nr:cytochrome b/b6 domain-containing protein [Burkholderiales bacterium]
MPSVRIWDLPTRLFHWVLALAVVLLVISAKVGGDAMHLHMRLGYLVFALLLFRLVWGVLGGHWSRFARFVPTPARLRAYLRGSPEASLHAGHNPLGALSVLAMLAVLSLQVASGLFADDEIAYSGPLTARASHAFVKLATRWHTGPGQALVLALVALHVAAIAWYWRRGQNLVRPMLSGDKSLTQAVPASRDGAGTRAVAVLVLAAAAAVVYAVVQWGARASLG